MFPQARPRIFVGERDEVERRAARVRRFRVPARSVGLGRPGCLLALLVWAAAVPASAQPAVPAEGNVQLNFPQEIEIQSLVDYVSKRLKIQILYDEQIANKRITVKAPNEIPATSLLSVLESALRMKGLLLVDAEAPGWKRIVQAQQLPKVATQADPDESLDEWGGSVPVTQAFVLQHADVQNVDQLIKPFLSDPGANTIAVPESGLIVVTDYASNIVKISQWIDFIDRPRVDVILEFVPLKNVAAASLSTQLAQLLIAKSKAQGQRTGAPRVEVSHDVRTNQLLLLGQRADVDEARKIIASLDVPLAVTARTYVFDHVSASRIDELASDLLDPVIADRLYRSTIDEDENILIVTTTDRIHDLIDGLKQTRDIPSRPGQNPVRFYKIKNLPVVELLSTIRGIEQQAAQPDDSRAGGYDDPGDGQVRPILGIDPATGEARPVPSGPNNPPPPANPTLELPTPPSYRGPESQPPLESQLINDVNSVGSLAAGALLGQARITADVHTNTMIVVAEPAVQRIYAELIEKLDQRRPQVLIEAKLVIIDTSDDFSLGVEFSGEGKGARRLLGFSSFGLSEVDPITGALAIMPGLGFNGTLVDPDVADVVLRALTNHRRSRVISAPRILVNDNAEGQLSSVAEVPFTSVNASNTVATTSFAGFAEAGTTITVTPRISDEDHLQLDFVVTLNTFTGTGGDGVPPPRQTDEARSQVTIPDGHTVIVGGLNRRGRSWDMAGLPFIDRIPVLRYLGGSESKNQNSNSMFIFLRPVVLRDDKFRDLKYISDRDLQCAQECPDHPRGVPMWLP